MKILYITSLSGKRINNFMLSSILAANEIGLEYYLASNQSGAQVEFFNDCEKLGINSINIPFERNPLNLSNFRAYKKLLSIVMHEKFDIIHCNTPIGGLIGRLIARKTQFKNTIYMAHGFHFWKGSPFKNWLFYYPIEKYLSKYTDTLITINSEDKNLSNKLRAQKTRFINGVGIDTKLLLNYTPNNDSIISIKHQDKIVLTSTGELSNRKNHIVVLKALRKMKNKNVLYLICGQGALKRKLEKYVVKYGLSDNVEFLGFRNDVYEILCKTDIFVFPSKQEGLAISLMEAMAFSLPILASRIRGNVDMITNEKGGFLFDYSDFNRLAILLDYLVSNKEIRDQMGLFNKNEVLKYDIDIIKNDFIELYRSYIK